MWVYCEGTGAVLREEKKEGPHRKGQPYRDDDNDPGKFLTCVTNGEEQRDS